MAHTPPSGAQTPWRTLVEACRQRAHDRPTRPGYLFDSDGDEPAAELTFGELDLRARAIAAELSRHAEPGTRALLHYPPGLEFVTAFFGCLYAGIIAIPAAPLDGSRPDSAAAARSRAIVESSRPEQWLSATGGHERIDRALREAAGLASLRAIATDEVDPARAAGWQAPAIDAGSVAYLQYSSGSTGMPNGVMLTHGNVLHNVAAIRDLCAAGPAPVGAFWLPMFHDMGLVAGALMAVITGSRAKLLSPLAFVHQPVRWLSLLDEPGSISAAPNFAYELCARRVTDKQLAQLDLSGWSCAIVGAERVRAATLERFAERFAACGFRREAFAPCYGLAESTLLVTGGPLGRPPTVRHLDLGAVNRHVVAEAPAGGPAVPLVGCGEPRPGGQVVIVDPDTLRPCAPGLIGEICVAGPSVGSGYWGAPDRTRETFGLTIAGSEGSFLRTGDLGAFIDGQLFVSGRRKDLIIVDGQNYYPPDLEATVEGAHPAVRAGRCAVVAVDDGRGERIVVLAELSMRVLRRLGVDPGEIARAIRRSVSTDHSLAVDDVVLLRSGTLPFTSSGKLQRFACGAAYAAGRLDHRRIQAAPERSAA
jgi:acyl-CoA synthetase (AMP-forming)/AMP-acid ligase II